jgi:hypothetical protein
MSEATNLDAEATQGFHAARDTAAATTETRQAQGADQDVDYRALYERERKSRITLQGKYNAEVPRLQAQVRDLESKVTAGKPAASTGEDEDLELFRSESPSIAKAVDRLVEKKIEEIVAPMRSATETAQSTSQEAAIKAHFAEIRAAHPDFQSVVNSGQFNAWIAKLPDSEREGAEQTLDQGSSADVVGLLDRFKRRGAPEQSNNQVDETIAVTGRGAPINAGATSADVGAQDFAAGFNAKQRGTRK